MTDLHDPRLSALYKRAPRSEPDALSDARIRKAAHAAVGRGARRHIAAWAMAATLVLGVGIGWQVLLEPPMVLFPEQQMDGSSALQSASKPAPPATPAPAWPKAEVRAKQAKPSAAVPRSLSDAPATVPGEAERRAPAAARERYELMREQDAVSPGAAAPLRYEALMDSVGMARVESVLKMECDTRWPPPEADAAAWQQAIEQAREDGREADLNCLQGLYLQLFDSKGQRRQ